MNCSTYIQEYLDQKHRSKLVKNKEEVIKLKKKKFLGMPTSEFGIRNEIYEYININDIKMGFEISGGCVIFTKNEFIITDGISRKYNVFPIEIPTLAERKDDIPVLINHILEEIDENKHKNLPIFDDSAISALKEYIWPGNIRELKNLIERASIIFANKKINAKNIRENLLRINLPNFEEESNFVWEMTSELTNIKDSKKETDSTNNSLPHPNNYKSWFDYLDKIDLRRHLSEVECILIEGALKKNDGSVTSASKSLKINRTTLIEKMKKYSIPRVGND